MKKFLSLAVVALLCLGLNAQIVSSRSTSIQTVQKEKKEKNKFWYLRTGMNINKLVGDDAEGLDSKMGYDLTFGFQKDLGSVGLYWGMEFGLGSRGYKMEYSEEDYYGYTSYEEKLMSHNVHYSPFTLGYKYAITDKFKVDAHIGGFLSLDYAGKAKCEETYDGDTESYDIKLSDLDGWQRVDAGMKVGVGVWYDRFNLDFTWKRGFISPIDEEDVSVSSSNFMIRLGVAF